MIDWIISKIFPNLFNEQSEMLYSFTVSDSYNQDLEHITESAAQAWKEENELWGDQFYDKPVDIILTDVEEVLDNNKPAKVYHFEVWKQGKPNG